MAGHMLAEEFREHGKRVIDWIADYLAGIESYPVRSRVLTDLDDILLPGVTHWQHPGFFGYVPGQREWAGDPR